VLEAARELGPYSIMSDFPAEHPMGVHSWSLQSEVTAVHEDSGLVEHNVVFSGSINDAAVSPGPQGEFLLLLIF
jgi:hypothetical protein